MEQATATLAQAPIPPGFEEAIAAASQRGWEAVVLVVLIIGGFGFFGYMFRHYANQAQERETRLAGRVTHLEDLIREKLFSVIDNNSKIMAQMMEHGIRMMTACERIEATIDKFSIVLDNRPCMAMDAADRAKLVDLLVQHADGTHPQGTQQHPKRGQA